MSKKQVYDQCLKTHIDSRDLMLLLVERHKYNFSAPPLRFPPLWFRPHVSSLDSLTLINSID